MGWLSDFYSRRIVNVNVNVVLAGLLALPPTVLIVHLSRRFGVTDDQKLLITGITFIADITFDVVIYYALHWFANHLPSRARWVHPAYEGLSFVRDATLVQFERAIISPALYTVALGGQHILMHQGISREWATVIGFVAGIATARILHTIWMLRCEKKAMDRHRARAAARGDDGPPPPAKTANPAPVPTPAEARR